MRNQNDDRKCQNGLSMLLAIFIAFNRNRLKNSSHCVGILLKIAFETISDEVNIGIFQRDDLEFVHAGVVFGVYFSEMMYSLYI